MPHHTWKTLAATGGAAILAAALASCSSSTTTEATSTPLAVGSSAAASAGTGTSPSVPAGNTDPQAAIGEATCAQIVTDGLTQADAEAQAATAGLQTRVGSVDGQPNALTMDYIPTRITLTIDAGIVTGCTTG